MWIALNLNDLKGVKNRSVLYIIIAGVVEDTGRYFHWFPNLLGFPGLINMRMAQGSPYIHRFRISALLNS